MNYYVLENSNNAYFQEDLSDFPECSYEASTEGQPSGVVLAVDLDKKLMKVENSEAHTMIEASTASYKTRGCVFPYLLSCCHSGSSMIVHDCKGELLKFMEPSLTDKGYKKVVINFRDVKEGDRYNIWERPAWEYKYGNKGRAIEMFKSICSSIFSKYHSSEDPFWEFSASTYCLMLVMLCAEIYDDYKDVTFENIFKLHIQSNERNLSSTYIHRYFENDKDSLLYMLGSLTMEAPNDTKRSIFSIFVQGLSDYIMNDELCDMTYNSTFSIEEIIEDKVAVFLVSRDEASVHDELISCMVDQFYSILVDTAHEKYNGVLPRRVEIILDEFANMGKLNNITKMVSAARSRNIRFLFCVQSYKQLSQVYGKDVASIILDNCDNTIYLHSSDIETLKMVSDRCGERIYEDGSKRPLVSIEKLQYLNKGQALFLLNRTRPFFFQLPDASCYGVPFSEKLNLAKRDMQKRKSIDFRKVAEEKWENDKLLQIALREEKKAKQEKEEEKEHKKKERKANRDKEKAIKDSRGVIKGIDNALKSRFVYDN
ncbi:MAG: type IV secretory system conjugative DNA transfer family protein [Lachnospiraceae bacterium]|nr:type IV secretory system conjugative DNA transfer family protein [Lachnospiraceae bacterium]